MTATEEFIRTLEALKPGDLGKLRNLAGSSLDESVDGFDLFAGLWWPLRQKNQRAPRREVAWLITKLYAFCPMPQSGGATLASRLGSLKAADERTAQRWQEKFDKLLMLPLNQIEPELQWAISLVRDNGAGLDWVQLTDELSIWEREETRLKWARQYLRITR
ncbi:MAG: type I-E CRISPR-associated protein Cse2/CasB [Phycisphaerae bacterium]|nr:type I-E CRISPR-associated protein Cse2/CasB [Phycisphaerae bacterium]